MYSTIEQLKPNVVVWGPLFPEPVQVILITPVGAGVRLVGKGLNTSQVYEPILDSDQIATLEISTGSEPYDGNPTHFRLGIEALRIALAFEYDPYFSLSIARVDPLPHQLEAVYDYFLKLARIPLATCIVSPVLATGLSNSKDAYASSSVYSGSAGLCLVMLWRLR